MNEIDEIELDTKTRAIALKKLPTILDEPEMSEFDSAFLCGLLRREQPHKILEIGVAGGATTAFILDCLDEMSLGGGTNVFVRLHGAVVPHGGVYDRLHGGWRAETHVRIA